MRKAGWWTAAAAAAAVEVEGVAGGWWRGQVGFPVMRAL